ncbi:DUF4174 domain-containing protein [Microvirga subterranea]|uniref:Uncharacterized protein DUF4174 n=1 Tax=Microvirga subterranea TaxID=186651 RepID=A0A370HK45_9HYPH|nr:DUF4174 domain-containing protein [Microvirga subterranea]RDI58710.1 uncharacterized protein DUF4174 [Microvirga subterranea]
MSFSWQDNRVFILFAAAPDPRVDEQARDLLADRDALSERDMVVLAVIGDDVTPFFGDVPSEADARSLRASYGVDAATPFTALLVGKDGGVKWRETRPADPSELFGLIDTMPMRRAEMREED